MAIFNKKTPRMKTGALIDQISMGKCDDLVVSELKIAVSELTDSEETELIVTALKDIALKSGNPVSVAYSIKSLMAFGPLDYEFEESLEIRALELITSKVGFSNRALQEAVSEFLYMRISARVDRAAPFVEALVQYLDERTGTGGTTAYNSLMIVAANRPEYFQPHAAPLIKMLGSINKVTRIQTTRLIAVLAMSHPEYVADAEKTLLHLSSFNPDGELKNSASEALQILESKLRPNEPTPIDDMESRRLKPDTTGGLADIMRGRMVKDKKVLNESRIDKRLLAMATKFSQKGDRAYKTDGDAAGSEEADTEAMHKIMDDFSDIAQSIKAEGGHARQVANAEAAPQEAPEHQESSEEAELRRVMEKVKDDFSINAGSILDALGMGHMAKKADEARPRTAEVPVRDRPKRTRLTRTEPARHEHVPEKAPAKKIVEEEEDVSPKEFIASIESIISRTEKEHAEMTAPPAPVALEEPTATTASDGAGSTMAANTVAANSPVPEITLPEPATPVEAALPAVPPEAPMPDIAAQARPESPLPTKSPIISSGVRISAMKFKSIDQSKSKKTPTPPKISIRPHITPLNKTPIDGIKMAQTRQHPMATAPLAPRRLEPKAEAALGEIVCHSCNAKMPEDSQRCAICGSDLKAPKVRCRKCGEINPRGADQCNRCGSGMWDAQ
jgi:ribosomal protein L40E